MLCEVVVVLETDLTPAQLLSEIDSHLDSLPGDTHTALKSLVILVDGEEVAALDKEKS